MAAAPVVADPVDGTFELFHRADEPLGVLGSRRSEPGGNGRAETRR
jgi:hypothetical protein